MLGKFNPYEEAMRWRHRKRKLAASQNFHGYFTKKPRARIHIVSML